MFASKPLLFTLLITMLLFPLSAIAQQGSEQHDHAHEHVHEEDGQAHEHTNEFSIAAGLVHVPNEKELGVGFHLHYVRGLGEKKIVGLGASFEAVLESHKHLTLAPVLHIRVYKGLIFGYAPGILFLLEDEATEVQFSQHVELAYEFEVGKVHLGPLFEIGIEKEGVHFMFGAHIGFDF